MRFTHFGGALIEVDVQCVVIVYIHFDTLHELLDGITLGHFAGKYYYGVARDMGPTKLGRWDLYR